MQIIVQNLRPVNDGSNLRMLADVKIEGDMLLRDCRIVQQPGHRAFMQLPSVEFETRGGRRAFKPLVDVGEDIKSQVSRKLLKIYAKEIAPDLNVPRTKVLDGRPLTRRILSLG